MSSQPDLIVDNDSVPLLPPRNNPEVDLEVLKQVPKQFSVENDASANWLVKQIVFSRQYAARVKEWAEQELRRAEREEQTLMFLFGRQISTYVRAQIDRLNGRRKSLNLPAGTVGFRTVGPRLIIDDEPAVMNWAKENVPSAVVIVEKLSKTTLNEYVEKTGAIPDVGAHVEAQTERFYIK